MSDQRYRPTPPDDYLDAIAAGDLPEDYDVDLWRAERDLDEQMAAADDLRKQRQENP